MIFIFFFFQAEDGIRDLVRSRGLGDVYKRQSWSSEEKFAAVVETASLTELEVSAFCRHKGIYPEQLGTWRETCRQANTALPSKAERAERRAEREEVQRLTRELAYKDRALAAAAALRVLQKKVRQIWEESEAAPSPRNGASR